MISEDSTVARNDLLWIKFPKQIVQEWQFDLKGINGTFDTFPVCNENEDL